MRPVNAVITRVIKESPNITTLRTNVQLASKPGQFVMVWVRGLDEIPMALSYPDGITVQNVGETTSVLSSMKPGDSIGLRGPFGKGFELTGKKIMVIAGGVGGAPLLPLARMANQGGLDVTALIGARTAEELLFEAQFSRCGSVCVATDDGSRGHHGFITGLMQELPLESYDQFYICGPELMMRNILDIMAKKKLISLAQFSLHRYFKCGIGVCGSCTIDPEGLRVCRDGPVFRGDRLLSSEMGHYHRNGTGKKLIF